MARTPQRLPLPLTRPWRFRAVLTLGSLVVIALAIIAQDAVTFAQPTAPSNTHAHGRVDDSLPSRAEVVVPLPSLGGADTPLATTSAPPLHPPLPASSDATPHSNHKPKLPLPVPGALPAPPRQRFLDNRPSASLASSLTHHRAPRVQEATVARSNLFEGLDADDDNMVGKDEIRRFISEYIGTRDFDSPSEIDEATTRAMDNAQIHDDLSDSISDTQLSLKDVQLHWERLGRFMSVDEVADWITHAVQLPQYRDAFVANSITGYDFPALLENTGESLRLDLGVTNKLHRAQIMRAVRMKLLAIGDPPGRPATPLWSATCSEVQLKWLPPDDHHVSIHKFVLQRRVEATAGAWATVYAGRDEWFTDYSVEVGTSYSYRLQAWNALGHSNFTVVDNVHTLRGCTASSGYSSDGGGRDGASSSGWSFSLSGIVSGVQNVFTLLAVLLFMYRLRQHMRLGLFGAGGGAGNHHGSRPTSASGLRRRPSGSGTRNLGMVHRTSTGQLSTAGLLHTTSNGRISDGAVPGTPPPMDTLDLADGTHVVSTEDAQRHAADVTPMAEDQSRCCVCHKKFKTIKYRRKHHCSVCHRKFCSGHGYTPHMPFSSCTVPSSCICKQCLHR